MKWNRNLRGLICAGLVVAFASASEYKEGLDLKYSFGEASDPVRQELPADPGGDSGWTRTKRLLEANITAQRQAGLQAQLHDPATIPPGFIKGIS